MTSKMMPTTTRVIAVVPDARRRGSRLRARFTGRFVRRQLIGAAASLLFVLVVNFFLFRVINPHPERTLGRGRARTAEQLAEISHRLGLDQPLPMQFLT